MEDLIFISQRIPYPPNKGDKLRSWNELVVLSKHYNLHLGTFIDDPVDWKHEDVIRDICRSYCLVPLNKITGKFRSLRALALGEALTLPYFFDARLQRWANEVKERFGTRRAFTFSSGVAGYVMGARWSDVRRVHDMVDVDSDKWRQYGAKKAGVARWIYGREGQKLFQFESKVAAEYDVTLFVSDYEAELFRNLSPQTASKVHSMRNGVDAGYFDPGLRYENPFPEKVEPIVLTGTMDYWPNVDAAVWFANQAFSRVRLKRPNAVFYVVGANPVREALALGEKEGIVVTGRVEDIRPYIAHANVIVAPLQVARGVQNKVLEGMAMAKPVIVSPMALEGIEAEPGGDLVLARNPMEFADWTIRIIENGGTSIGEKGRARVLHDYSWERNLAKLYEYLEA